MVGFLNRFAHFSTAIVATVALLPAAALADGGRPPKLTGAWSATVTVNEVDVPFRFEIAEKRGVLTGAFFDGDKRVVSSAGRFVDGVLTLPFDQYGARIEAALRDGQLAGKYWRGSRPPYGFRASRATAAPKPSTDAPPIAGLWTIGVKSAKGETAWRFIVRQTGTEVSAAVLRVDGDTGTLTGGWRDGVYVLSHFSGARPLLLEVTPVADGSLKIVQNKKTELVAVRAESEKAKELGTPTDPALHTSVKDPTQPLAFSFPGLDGRIVANTDARFAGKVVLVNITGSWCPNCHDEAPFLSHLYKQYRSKGLEVVALAFEETDQLASPTRLRHFIERNGIEYTVLLAGIPDDVAAKLPQTENLNSFPTTFFVGRDGRVRGVHAGFPSQASGSFYAQATREITEQVERLLAERAPGTY
jgi:thiol-disulfide isomerase/thioredoxin